MSSNSDEKEEGSVGVINESLKSRGRGRGRGRRKGSMMMPVALKKSKEEELKKKYDQYDPSCIKIHPFRGPPGLVRREPGVKSVSVRLSQRERFVKDDDDKSVQSDPGERPPPPLHLPHDDKIEVPRGSGDAYVARILKERMEAEFNKPRIRIDEDDDDILLDDAIHLDEPENLGSGTPA